MNLAKKVEYTASIIEELFKKGTVILRNVRKKYASK